MDKNDCLMNVPGQVISGSRVTRQARSTVFQAFAPAPEALVGRFRVDQGWLEMDLGRLIAPKKAVSGAGFGTKCPLWTYCLLFMSVISRF